MIFNRGVLKKQIDEITRLEHEMYDYYIKLLGELKDPSIKDRISRIKDQEEAHAEMVSEIEVILSEELGTM